jgi:hypothetical protein
MTKRLFIGYMWLFLIGLPIQGVYAAVSDEDGKQNAGRQVSVMEELRLALSPDFTEEGLDRGVRKGRLLNSLVGNLRQYVGREPTIEERTALLLVVSCKLPVQPLISDQASIAAHLAVAHEVGSIIERGELLLALEQQKATLQDAAK